MVTILLNIPLYQFCTSQLFHVWFCFFLTRVQVSQKIGRMVLYSHLFKSFPQFVMIHTAKGFSVVNETMVDLFLEFPYFLYDPAKVDNLISGSSAFSKSCLDICNFLFHVMLKHNMQDCEHNPLALRVSVTVWWLEHSLALCFLGTGMRIVSFQSYGHSWIFQICWHIECNTLITSSFSILNSFAEIPSSPLALLATVPPQGLLNSHSQISSSGWVTTPSWLSGSLSYFCFVQFFCVFLPSLLDHFCSC